MPKESSTKPIKTFRHRGISASVFENRSEKNVPFYKIAIVRTYKDGDEFKSTPTYSHSDLPMLVYVANEAFDYVLCKERDQRAKRLTKNWKFGG